jgi:hypothetical protein
MQAWANYVTVAATLPVGSVDAEPQIDDKGERLIWLEERWINKLRALRGKDESYSDVILRLADEGAGAKVVPFMGKRW